MDKVKALGAIFHKLELREKERKLGITLGLTPELFDYYKMLSRFDATYRYPEDRTNIEAQTKELVEKFYDAVELCVMMHGERGQTIFYAVSEFLRSLRLEGEILEAAGSFIKFRSNDEFRTIK
ncbi:MAG: hypothetical protein EOP04_01880 [Proteobacteria bacterium]|nr:MAG: hypothetical protein EOP04_01880 [Pseudomonadota bacterium]